MTKDWLGSMLDRHSAHLPPRGFRDRVYARIKDDEAVVSPQGFWQHARPWAAAAAILLSVSFWFGWSAPPITELPIAVSRAEVEALLTGVVDLGAWNLVSDDFIALALANETLGTWVLEYGGDFSPSSGLYGYEYY